MTRHHGNRTHAPRPILAGGVWDVLFYLALAVYLAWLTTRVATLPLFEWDESRNVLNAYEMVRSGDWVATRLGGALDHWNLKPPLFIWILAVLFRAFGYSELVARLPSLVFGLGTAALVYRFVAREAGDRTVAALSGLALVTSTGFYGFDGLTSADVDVAITFFNTLAFVAVFYIFVEPRPRWGLALAPALALGFMTKSVIGWIPLASIPIAFLLNRGPKRVVPRDLVWGLAAASLIVVPWLVARQHAYPDDYIGMMLRTDILRRSQMVVERHAGGLNFYYLWAGRHLGIWLYAGLWAAASLVNALLPRRGDGRAAPAAAAPMKAGIYAALTVLVYYLTFTASASKLTWYLFPAYPLLFILIGIAFSARMPYYIRMLRHALLLLMLLANLFEIRAYESHRETGAPMVDYLLFPYESELRHHAMVTQGDLRQNAFTLTRVYSDLQVCGFADGTSLEQMLGQCPAAEYLITTDSEPLLASPRLQLLRKLHTPGEARQPGLFRIVHI